jgi:hypothetical protein
MKEKTPILIIVKAFVPYEQTLGSVLRAIKVSNYLYEHNFDIHILAAKGVAITYFGYEKEVKRYNLHYYEDKFQEVACKYHLSKPKQKEEQTVFKQIKGKVISLGRELVGEFIIPDWSQLYAKNCLEKAIEIINKYNIKNVIASSPPPSVTLTGYKLKKHFKDKINLIIDYRDSWNAIPVNAKKLPIIKQISQNIEKKVLSECDYFTMVYNPMLPAIEKKYKIKDFRKKALLIRNATVLEKENYEKNRKSQKKYDKIKIGYFGAIPSNRSPKKLLEFIENNEKYKKIFDFHFYGISESLYDYSFVHFKGRVPYETALEKMNEMSLLMISFIDKKTAIEMISAKFFEYIKVGKPLLIYGPNFMNASVLTKNKKLGYVLGILPENETQVKKVLDKIISDFNENNLITYDYEQIKEFDLNNQFSKFLEILK